jgi:hypothetical protein
MKIAPIKTNVPRKLKKFKVGDPIEHRYFGRGTVSSFSFYSYLGWAVDINFNLAGFKSLMWKCHSRLVQMV